MYIVNLYLSRNWTSTLIDIRNAARGGVRTASQSVIASRARAIATHELSYSFSSTDGLGSEALSGAEMGHREVEQQRHHGDIDEERGAWVTKWEAVRQGS